MYITHTLWTQPDKYLLGLTTSKFLDLILWAVSNRNDFLSHLNAICHYQLARSYRHCILSNSRNEDPNLSDDNFILFHLNLKILFNWTKCEMFVCFFSDQWCQLSTTLLNPQCSDSSIQINSCWGKKQ